jgi:hypothetical protein
MHLAGSIFPGRQRTPGLLTPTKSLKPSLTPEFADRHLNE